MFSLPLRKVATDCAQCGNNIQIAFLPFVRKSLIECAMDLQNDDEIIEAMKLTWYRTKVVYFLFRWVQSSLSALWVNIFAT